MHISTSPKIYRLLMEQNNLHQSYLKDCNCSHNGVIIWNGKTVCRWCGVPYAKGGSVFYMPEYLNSKQQSVSNGKKALFVSEDNVVIYEGERCWYVKLSNFESDFYDFIDMGDRDNDLKHFPTEFKYFSTKEALNEYILFNSPKLSLNDLLSVWDDGYIQNQSNRNQYKGSSMFKRFENLAQSKIKNQ